LEETFDIIRNSYPDAVVEIYQLDVGDESSVESFHSKTVSKFGRIDFAVNSAGYGHPATPTNKLSEKEWDLSYSVNQRGVSPSPSDLLPVLLLIGTGISL
jgi:NAD(P)-dependent dehydrogenase (short-subunit alcohol dehydrogenase family)